MSENGKRIHQGKLTIIRWKPQCSLARLRVKTGIEHVVMDEVELRRHWTQVFLTPCNHPAMQIDTKISSWLSLLLDELACDPATATTEVEDLFVGLRREIGIHQNASGIVECLNIGRAHQLPHLKRGQWQLVLYGDGIRLWLSGGMTLRFLAAITWSRNSCRPTSAREQS